MDAQARIFRVRAELLRQLNAVHPLAMTEAQLQLGIQYSGTPSEAKEVSSAIAALVEVGHAKAAPVPFNGAMKQYTMTETGRLALVEMNLA